MTSRKSNITVQRSGRVATIALNRPDTLNALNEATMNEVVETSVELDRDRGVGAILLTGAGRAFAAGADINEMKDKSQHDMYLANWFKAWDRFSALRTPVVAAVTGYALGGGCELAMMCDIVIAGTNSRFGQPEINLGIIPGIGGTQRLARAVGKAKAMDLVLTGRMMDADEAERTGLVSRVVPDRDVLDVGREVAETISVKSLPAIYGAKEAVNCSFETPLAEVIKHERRAFYATFDFEDQTEGMSAFLEKRSPRFQHR
jgi:enoyl-CoA hydratase